MALQASLLSGIRLDAQEPGTIKFIAPRDAILRFNIVRHNSFYVHIKCFWLDLEFDFVNNFSQGRQYYLCDDWLH